MIHTKKVVNLRRMQNTAGHVSDLRNEMKKLVSIMFLSCLIASTASYAQAPNVGGRYVGTVQVELLEEGRKVKLLSPLKYIDPAGVEWLAPAGWIVDGASIPRVAWSVIGGPFEGKYRNASVIHDVACDQKTKPWNSVHEVFYYAMLTSGVDTITAKVMYAAVFHFGPRWATKNAGDILGGADDIPPAPTLKNPQADFEALKATIETRESSGNPITLSEVRTFRR